MLAAWVEDGQNHQIGISEQPFLRLRPGGLRSARDKTKVLAARKALEMVEANSCEPGDFIRGEELLAGFDRDQVDLTHLCDAAHIVNAARKLRAIVFPFLYTKTL